MSIGLAVVVLASSAYSVGAQGVRPSIKAPQDRAVCQGVGPAQATQISPLDNETASWPKASVLFDEGMKVSGKVSGLFFNEQSQENVQKELSFDELKGYRFIPQNNYILNCDIHAAKGNTSYFSMGRRGVLFGAQFDRGVANITAKFPFSGSDVDPLGIKIQSGAAKDVFPAVSFPAIPSDDKESLFKGSVTGGFANEAGKVERRTLNIVDTSNFYPLGGLFDFSGQFSGKGGKLLRFAGLMNQTSKTDTLSVLTEEAFSSVKLRSSIGGKEYMSDEFSHVALSTEKIQGLINKSQGQDK